MEIYIKGIATEKNSTISKLSLDDQFLCFVLEDGFRVKKIPGETRIPAGRYEIKLRTEGGKNEKYEARFPRWHRGMLHLQNVPGFTYVYIHIGNTVADTLGCLLTGCGVDFRGGEFTITRSTDAYKDLYKRILSALDAAEKVFVNIDRGP